MAGNTAEALRRIHENKRTRSKILDLSGLGLSELPEELWDCVWVEELGLGYLYCWYEKEQSWDWDYKPGKNKNTLSSLPNAIGNLTNLSHIFLDNTTLVDLSPISSLTNLISLNLTSTQVSDLNPLSNLTSLRSLRLGETQVSDLSPLSNLMNLRDLNLYHASMNDLSPLSGLTNLSDLNLYYTSISDLSPISSLTNLISLNLTSTQVSDLNPIRGLTNLKSLRLGEIQVSDLSPLSSLTNLISLHISEIQVSDLSPISSLTNLISLDLTSIQVSDLSPIRGLTNLKSLRLGEIQVSDLSPLSSLTNLISLHISEIQVSDLSPISNLTNLICLHLNCIQMNDLIPLNCLTNLRDLNLGETSLPYFPFELLWLPKLKSLNLQNTHCLNLPPELTYESNALPALLNYYNGLQKNPYPSYQAKLITVGNGRVGKTSVLKTLFQLGDFDPQEDSTHGIRLFKTEVPLSAKSAEASLQLWDFGGQELYHATHRIFMKSRALYLLLWDQHTEENPGEESVNIQGKPYLFRNFPLSYWLGNIRALSRDAKIIVVCNKADGGEEHLPTRINELKNQYKVTFFRSVSAKTGYGIPALYQRVQELLAQMPEMGMPMPLSWKQVQDQLAAIEDQPYISIETYLAICAKEELSEGSAYTLLRFLHHSGFVFWHEQYLGNQIVLDQKWALDAIYTLLDRNAWYVVLKGDALRKRSVLAKCWTGHSAERVQIFLEIMQSCELALKIGDEKQEDPTYLIPEFLPDQPATAVAYAWEGTTTGPIYHFRFQHHFFHAALIQRFIVRSAKLAESYDLLWRSGILLKVEDTLARIQVYPEAGRIDVLLHGTKTGELIERLKNEITKIQEVEGETGFLLSLSGQPNEWVSLEQVEQHLNKGKSHIASTSGEVLELAPFRALIHTPHQEEKDQPLDLKELADRESGTQLLQKTEVFSLMEFKAIAKTKLMDDIEATLQYLQEKIQPASSAFDELILLKGQWNGLKRQDRAGILSQNDNQLNENQIRSRILSLINDLQDLDVKG